MNRDNTPVRITPPGKGAAVLIPLLRVEGEWNILFEVRNPGIAQGGEICFPGGKVEPGEKPSDAAVRETREELLVRTEQIRCVEAQNLVTGPGGRDIYSYSGVLEGYQNTFSEAEVARIFTVPVKELLRQRPETYEAHYEIRLPDDFPYDQIPGGRNYPWAVIPRKLYFYRYLENRIWGLTAELLHAFLENSRGGMEFSCADRPEAIPSRVPSWRMR
ncbi:MAG: NUDIX hydrolase [Bilifractor porci]|jgi:coenzyme A diphosphatase NUDT7